MALGMAFQGRDDMLDGDGFCALLGAEKCGELTAMYTEKALELLGRFEDNSFLRKMTEELSGRNV
jgi:geranylgeranyl pyrophosphate synthase